MIEAVDLFEPDIVICPFLTTAVPSDVFTKVITLIVHPGPPGDIGPSSLDWILMGDDGTIDDHEAVLQALDGDKASAGRTHWGVTVLQATEELDAGPVWSFDQFEIDIDEPGLTKASLYRGAITRAAICAVRAALRRIEAASVAMMQWSPKTPAQDIPSISNLLECGNRPDPEFAELSLSGGLPFQGGRLHHRPLLRAASRAFDVSRHTSTQVSRRIRASDSQPGVLSTIFGSGLYVYGGTVQELGYTTSVPLAGTRTTLLKIRDDGVCIAAADGKGVWITHVRRPKTKSDVGLWPKVPAVPELLKLGIIDLATVERLANKTAFDVQVPGRKVFREVWVDFLTVQNGRRIALLHFEFYNGAMSTDRCFRLSAAMRYILSQHAQQPIAAVVLMGGTYFSNGIALNVIEASSDPVRESLKNIDAINNVVKLLLLSFPQSGIVTIAAVRGNAAAGGVAIAASCDHFVAGCNVVLNPSYGALGLFGSEYHTISYRARCGERGMSKLKNDMMPMSGIEARAIGLVDVVFPDFGDTLTHHILEHIAMILEDGYRAGVWKRGHAIDRRRLKEVNDSERKIMDTDFRSELYRSRRHDFVRKCVPAHTPRHLALHRPCCTHSSEHEFCAESLSGDENLPTELPRGRLGIDCDGNMQANLFECYCSQQGESVPNTRCNQPDLLS